MTDSLANMPMVRPFETSAATIDGWACWTGPSGTRYASPGAKSVVGVLSPLSDLCGVPSRVRAWLTHGVQP